MSSDISIVADRLGKVYRIPHARKRMVSRDEPAQGGGLLSRLRLGGMDYDDLWVLKDVSFEVRRGESVGLIGLNGSGKSTTFKILSRVTAPTMGTARIHGRLGALLEVGTGFHPELSGRENVYLYGSILGMTKEEIRKKFDDIVGFSEIGNFIDTPVKRYSSGMYVRLAFSVAAHLDPDILLLDEVLAVGDLSFQRKCTDFVKNLKNSGATILFVSHNMASIKNMCTRVLYLKQGRLVFDGDVESGLELYQRDGHLAPAYWAQIDPLAARFRFHSARLSGEDGVEKSIFSHGEGLVISMEYEAEREMETEFVVAVERSDGLHCCRYSSDVDGAGIRTVAGKGRVEVRVPVIDLTADSYSTWLMAMDAKTKLMLSAQGGPSFHVKDPVLESSKYGVFNRKSVWRHEP